MIQTIRDMLLKLGVDEKLIRDLPERINHNWETSKLVGETPSLLIDYVRHEVASDIYFDYRNTGDSVTQADLDIALRKLPPIDLSKSTVVSTRGSRVVREQLGMYEAILCQLQPGGELVSTNKTGSSPTPT